MSDDTKPVVQTPQADAETAPKTVNTQLEVTTRTLEATTGFLPGPKMLAEYEKISPGITERFFTLAERELNMDELELKGSLDNNAQLTKAYLEADRNGRIFAVGLFGLMATFAFILAFVGNNLGAGILLSAAVISGIKALLPNAQPAKNTEEQKSLPPNQ